MVPLLIPILRPTKIEPQMTQQNVVSNMPKSNELLLVRLAKPKTVTPYVLKQL